MTTLMDEAVDAGTTKRLSRRFMSLDTVPLHIDPATVTLFVTDPDGARYSVATHRDIYGDYYGDVSVPTSGQWRYHWVTTGPGLVLNGSFVVRRDMFSTYKPPDFDGALSWDSFGALSWDDWAAITWSEWQ